MYYGINNIDKQLHEKYFQDEQAGFFIEAGANDGIRQSNTFFFEQMGWNGLLIEPIPQLAKQCKNNRDFSIVENAALVAHDYNLPEIVIEYTPKSNGLMSVMKGLRHTNHHLKKAGNEVGQGIMVPALTLDQILEKHADFIPGLIDLMILDIEGYEPQALTGINFKKWNIQKILIEQQYNSKKIDELLLPHYNKIDQLSEHDFLWQIK